MNQPKAAPTPRSRKPLPPTASAVEKGVADKTKKDTPFIRTRKGAIIVGAIALLFIIAIAVGVGVGVGSHKKGPNNASGAISTDDTGGGLITLTDPTHNGNVTTDDSFTRTSRNTGGQPTGDNPEQSTSLDNGNNNPPPNTNPGGSVPGSQPTGGFVGGIALAPL